MWHDAKSDMPEKERQLFLYVAIKDETWDEDENGEVYLEDRSFYYDFYIGIYTGFGRFAVQKEKPPKFISNYSHISDEMKVCAWAYLDDIIKKPLFLPDIPESF